MESVKDTIIAHIKELPEDASYDDILQEISLIQSQAEQINLSRIEENPEKTLIQQIDDQYNLDKTWILERRENQEGFTEESLNTIAVLVKQLLLQFNEKFKFIPTIPKFLPGPSGTVDLMWKSSQAQFIANIPIDDSTKIEYYGKDENNNETYGTVNDLDQLTELLRWTMN